MRSLNPESVESRVADIDACGCAEIGSDSSDWSSLRNEYQIVPPAENLSHVALTKSWIEGQKKEWVPMLFIQCSQSSLVFHCPCQWLLEASLIMHAAALKQIA